jgi:hypothetical protein
MLSPTNINNAILIKVILTMALMPLIFLVLYKLPIVFIYVAQATHDGGLYEPFLDPSVGNGCIIIIWGGVLNGTIFVLPLQLPFILIHINILVEQYNTAFELFDALSQTVTSDYMLEDMVGGVRAPNSEIREGDALLAAKHILATIRVLESIYERYDSTYVSPIGYTFFEE